MDPRHEEIKQNKLKDNSLEVRLPTLHTLYFELLCEFSKYLLKRNHHFWQHQMSKTNVEAHAWKHWWNEATTAEILPVPCTISLNFISSTSIWCNSRQIFKSLAFIKCKKGLQYAQNYFGTKRLSTKSWNYSISHRISP